MRSRRSTIAFACVVLLMSAACGRPKDEPPAGPFSVGGGVGAPTTTAATSPQAAPPSDEQTPATGGGGSAGAPSGTATPGPTRGRATSSGAKAPAPADAAGGPVGSFARTLLQPQPATRLAVDVIVQEGADYRGANLEHTLAVLRDVSGKPVEAVGPMVFSSASRSHSGDAIRALAAKNARTPQGSGVAAIRLLILRGTLDGDNGVLGVAVQGEVMAIFPEQTARAATVAVSRQRIEEAVLTHELGHLLGLVDLVIDRNREDPSHRGHSKNPESVMYYAVESDLITQVLAGPPPVSFDAADRSDLAAIRAGG